MPALTSSSFENDQEMAQKHGKKIDNISPQLSWKDVPKETKSFALALVDRHPVARDYVHWLVVDIPADVDSLDEDAADGRMPEGCREVKPYAGPFPPSGTHDYEFTLYALKTEKLELPKKVPLDAFLAAVEGETLATATLVGKFRKIRAPKA